MNEYNERILKTVLQDVRAENDEELLREIEEAKNDPLYSVKEGEAEAFAEEYLKKTTKKPKKTFLKVASIILVLMLAGISAIPVAVEGEKYTIAEIVINFVNSEFLAFDSNKNDSLLLSYKGEYVPTYIPEGYSVKSVKNESDRNEIIFANKNNCMLTYQETTDALKFNADYTDAENLKHIEILGFDSVSYKEDGFNRIVIATENSIIYISCNDDEVDLVGFANLIEKR